jgi:SAM-dependent methyltransferase
MHCPDDWYETFFHGVALDLWRTFATPEYTRAEADALVALLGVGPPARLLDVPCGNGRLALELAARGYRTAGVDIAAESIAEGQAEAARRNLDVPLRQGDMRRLDDLGTFDGAICWGNSFGYLEDEGNRAFLHAVAARLAPGAPLLLEFGTLAELLFPTWQERAWYPVGDIHLLIANEYDFDRGRLLTEYTFIRDGVVDVRRGSQQVWTFRELRGWLREAGLSEAEALSYPDGGKLRLGGKQRAVVRARKAG